MTDRCLSSLESTKRMVGLTNRIGEAIAIILTKHSGLKQKIVDRRLEEMIKLNKPHGWAAHQ